MKNHGGKSCAGCIHAKWERTKKGRLHPSGEGRCHYDVSSIPLPVAFGLDYSDNCYRYGGGINRHYVDEHVACHYYDKEGKS